MCKDITVQLATVTQFPTYNATTVTPLQALTCTACTLELIYTVVLVHASMYSLLKGPCTFWSSNTVWLVRPKTTQHRAAGSLHAIGWASGRNAVSGGYKVTFQINVSRTHAWRSLAETTVCPSNMGVAPERLGDAAASVGPASSMNPQASHSSNATSVTSLSSCSVHALRNSGIFSFTKSRIAASSRAISRSFSPFCIDLGTWCAQADISTPYPVASAGRAGVDDGRNNWQTSKMASCRNSTDSAPRSARGPTVRKNEFHRTRASSRAIN
mmetsp:Transcript_49900/g.108947  ORF Transcript_49900/g.108947 Transcript_49900/m.108947 type:complete len:270 (-) Transcript_49900:199-1008(-)